MTTNERVTGRVISEKTQHTLIIFKRSSASWIGQERGFAIAMVHHFWCTFGWFGYLSCGRLTRSILVWMSRLADTKVRI